ncbi:MAG: S8 family serine peptidase, partial [Promethearchaeota archaeon]
MKLYRSKKSIKLCLLAVFFTLFLSLNNCAIAYNPDLNYGLQSGFTPLKTSDQYVMADNPDSGGTPTPLLNPRIVHPSQIHDADGDKIADQLSELLDKKNRNPSFTSKAIHNEDDKVEVMICVDEKPNDALIDKLRGYGAEIASVYDKLVYAISATIPIDKVNEIATDPEVVFIEKEAYSTVHLDTSTVNMGVRGSAYVWDAVPTIKGNPNYAVAILDTGVDSSHSDMGNFLYFQDFTSHGYPSGSTGVDYGHHGTHCASIAAGTGSADTTTQTVEQTISYHFHANVGWYYTTHWFEVKDHPANPSTIVTLDWDNSGGGSVVFGIRNSDGSWITTYGPYTGSSLTHNLGNVGSGWYQVVCWPETDPATNKDYTITVEHEYNYALSGEPVNTPVFTGVAPQSNIVSLKILDDTGSGTGTWFQDALAWISSNGKNSAYNITTVSMSIGFDGVYSSIDTAVNNLVDEGFICVTSAGNDGTNNGNNAVMSPGTAQKCITVGAVNDAFEVTYYSSNGDLVYNKPDVIAPGGTIVLSGSNSPHNLILAADSNYGEDDNSMTDVEANDYRGMQGTSMSCPHVAGLAQLAIDAIIQTEGSWTWSQANALKVKQLICMGTWEVQAGETFDGDGDGIPQNPSLNRLGTDVVEGYGMVRADAVIQAITHPTTGPFTNLDYYLDRRSGSYAKEPKVLLFSFDAQTTQSYDFSLNVPATGDFDLIIYDDNYDINSGRPIVLDSSINSGLDVDESIIFTPSVDGVYYWSIRAVEGYGTCQISMQQFIPGNSPPDLPTNPYPPNGALGISTNPILSVDVSDPDGTMMDVSFYDASNNNLIGTDTEVPDGGTASVIWSGRSIGSSYSWYAIADDGIDTTQSSTWSFTVSAETGIFAEFQSGTPPVLDGDLSDPYWSGDWDVYQEGTRLISIKVKHDKDNLYFAVQWTDNDQWDNHFFLYFEDDGTTPDKSLDSINEDCKYSLASFGVGTNQQLYDAHWDSNWAVGEDREGLYGASNVGNVWYVEASSPLSTGSIDDIDVTSPEILGFMLYTYYGYGNGAYPVGGDCYDPLTWTYLHVLPPFNTYPDSPTNPSPANGATGVSTSPTLSVIVSDLDGDSMHVSFYNATDDSLLGTDLNVPDGGTASVTWAGLAEGTSYSWYAVANDGTVITTSSTWSFTTYSDDPTWDTPPSDQLVEYGDAFSYDLDASDSSGISSWGINDTANFNIDSNGLVTNATALDIGVYGLEVRAYDPYGNYCNGTFTVTVQDTTPPAAPVLVSPSDATVTNDETPLLNWSVVSDAVLYQVQVDDSVSFSSPVVDTTTSNTFYTSPPLTDDMYYWRVRAQDAADNWGPWSSIWSFTIDTTPPAAPSLVSPSDGTATNDVTPFLDWNAVSEATLYQVQVDESVAFSSPVVDTTTSSTSYTTPTLTDNTYYWRVRARDAVGNWGAWSSIWSFTIDTTPPAAPALVSPSDGTMTNDNTPLLDWNAVSEATLYQVQVDESVAFSSPVV